MTFLSLMSLGLSVSVEALPCLQRSTVSLSSLPSIRWSNCSASGLDQPRIQCGFISVPLDYGHCDNGTVELGMARLSAPQSARLGTLFYNPGGPGGIASDFVLDAAKGSSVFSQSLLKRYDIVGLDPRGVGLSQPVKCDPGIFNERVSSFPDTEEKFQDLIAHNEALGKSCVDLTGPLINHLDTVNVVRDMELVRRALNDKAQLNFLGQSYGSQIGLTYAELFPENINRMVLDGILDHTQDETTTLNDEATAYEMTLNQFFAWCNTAANCTLQGRDATSVYDSVVHTAEQHPIPAPGCSSISDSACRSDVTGEEIRTNVQNLLLFQNATAVSSGWDKLSAAIEQAAGGNATLLSSPLATSETAEEYPGLAIGCQDWLHESADLADLRYKINMGSATAPRTRGSTQTYYYQTNCLGWPAPNTNPQRRLSGNVSAAPPILLVNSLYDPSTSIVWATKIQRQVPKSILLTRSGSGHTSYELRGEAAAAMDAFLIDGVLPRPASIVGS
ncbi:MAG: hypothetical protein Q9166_006741 [cf. Caloplaca sp. 2 TL-2023]